HRRPNQLAIDRAVTVLNARGARLMRLDGVLTVGLWGDAVGPEVQSALRVLEMDTLPVRALGGAGIPTRYKLRRVQEFQNRLTWPELKAEMLNSLFKAQGLSGELGRITAETVKHGEASNARSPRAAGVNGENGRWRQPPSKPPPEGE